MPCLVPSNQLSNDNNYIDVSMAMYPLLNRNFLLFVQHEEQVCFATTTVNDNSSTPAHYWNMEFGLPVLLSRQLPLLRHLPSMSMSKQSHVHGQQIKLQQTGCPSATIFVIPIRHVGQFRISSSDNVQNKLFTRQAQQH